MNISQIIKLRWWVLVCSIVTATLFTWHQGGLAFLWNADKTKISFVTLVIFFLVSSFIGYLTLKLEPTSQPVPDSQDKRYIDACWLASEILMGLGLMGTTLGIILMFNGLLGGINATDPTALKGALMKMAPGLTTALVTTFVGITTSMLTKIQLMNYSVNIQD